MSADRLPRLTAKVLIAGLIVYVAWRALSLSMTCDEAWTAEALPYPGFFSFITPSFFAGLNVHLLNSWLINLCLTVFGEHDWAVRLPALAGGICYLCLAYRLSARLFDGWAVTAATALLTANPYLLDFFSVGRGYALGLGLTMLGLSRLLAARDARRPPWHLVFFALAALANLSFLYAYLTALALAVIRFAWQARQGSRPRGRALAAACLPVLATLVGLSVIYGPTMRIAAKHNEYWWGSADGFVGGGLTSLFAVTLYRTGIDPALPRLLAWMAMGLLTGLALAAVATRAWTGPRRPIATAFFTLLAFYGIVWAGVTVEHALFGTPYLMERGMLFLWPVLVLAVCGGIGCLPPGRAWRWAGGGLLVGLCLIACGNFARAANLAYTFTWRNDACSRPFMRRIARENYPRNFTREKIGIAVSHMAIHTLDYYVRHLRMAYVDTVRGLEYLPKAAYGIMPADLAATPKVADRFEVIMTCPASGLVLTRRRGDGKKHAGGKPF
ncbi:hypothetical protein DesfrDRAFT_3440 [Solidesulfovibrio fructosivorans JJ]]|uniref:Glycosyltransferase RgtA/B/C/D-like domain-containing protein n=1 Tax=Solidesulfovibrio fructosivorans JJ] TaxID=596151 RepID=E1K0P0_SOLFR|nr:glycosyltransferase family 39 protein [Solidesulfovibrio fructosivorans]EFL49804.1 hypothetical protein DesfrDRAFT_3440 [Solidesulfovibrio fructosivorans JJ]]